jgi:hypothetical protein
VIIDEEWKVIWDRKYGDEIEKIILKKSPLSNPSSMFKKDYFTKVWGYDKNLNYWEDYDLWVKFFTNWYKLKNLNKDLLKYRIREWQTKQKKVKETIKNTLLIQKRAVKNWLKASFSDRIYHFLEMWLLLFPEGFILWLFKKIEYKWKRKN